MVSLDLVGPVHPQAEGVALVVDTAEALTTKIPGFAIGFTLSCSYAVSAGAVRPRTERLTKCRRRALRGKDVTRRPP